MKRKPEVTCGSTKEFLSISWMEHGCNKKKKAKVCMYLKSEIDD